jgi:predicted Ser/Thr protein kinase
VTDPSSSDRPAWAAVNDVFHRALEVSAERRGAFLDAACAGQPALREEVESLLAAHEEASDFIEAPAADAAQLSALIGPAAESMVGRTLGHYHIERVLGEGGMGVVYLASDTRLGRAVALKALAPRFTGDHRRRERLRREAQAAAQLSHPGIATIYALEEFDEHLYIASEYVAGETLRAELARGPLPIARVLDTARGLAAALALAHERGIVHRDLKPENVVRAADGHVKILDFGLARLRDAPAGLAHLTDDGMILGTPAYMAPEQIRGQPVDFRADLFALGALLYELVAGVHPFAGSDPTSTIAKILEAQPPALGPFRPSGPANARQWAALEAIIRRCLEKRPDDRFASTPEVVRALERLDGGVHPPPAAPPTLWWWQFHQAAVSITYSSLIYALMHVLLSERQDPRHFVVLALGVVAVLVAITLRLHLWFSHRLYPEEWPAQHKRARGWIRVADLLFVAVQLTTAAIGFGEHRHIALLLIASAAATFVASTFIEPATTRAAFGSRFREVRSH